jgi:hypothetical protein
MQAAQHQPQLHPLTLTLNLTRTLTLNLALTLTILSPRRGLQPHLYPLPNQASVPAEAFSLTCIR